MRKNCMRFPGKIVGLFFLSIFLLAVHTHLYAQKLYQERIYEPVVLRGGILSAFYNVPVDQLYLYAYDDSTQTWHMMPFQIDERIRTEDPFKPGNEDAYRHTYFIADDGLLDEDDELVFMVRDLGDRAPNYIWIDNEEARNNQRLEITVYDPTDTTKKAYAYLFQSTTITEQIPTPYGFAYDPENKVAESNAYSVRIGQDDGLIKDIIIKPPYGTGVDFFDTQKIRFIGLMDFGTFAFTIGRNGKPAANERDNLYVYPDSVYQEYTKNPVVRLIREVRETIRFGTIVIGETAFYVNTKFYPFSGELAGGADLDPEKLKREFNTEEDIYIEFDLLRQSWDFNQAATGMKFYNEYNDAIPIDGVPDEVNKQVDLPIREWTMTSGDQGTLFTFVSFLDTLWNSVELYYYDNQAGGQGDETVTDGGDTGDSLSFGDHGLIFRELAEQKVSLKLGFTAYFLPGNKDEVFGRKLANWVEHPVHAFSYAITFPTKVEEIGGRQPQSFALYQNYPNPFNSSTIIRFRVPDREHVTLQILDLNGRTVATLIDKSLSPGVHQLRWNGKDDKNQDVASGVYFYRLQAGQHEQMKKLIFVK